MVLKKLSRYTELTFFIDAQRLTSIMPFSKRIGDFIEEVEAFVKRNSLGTFASRIDTREEIHHCCPRCLKAFALKRCGERGLPLLVEGSIVSMFDCEWGHGGYFIDGDELVKI